MCAQFWARFSSFWGSFCPASWLRFFVPAGRPAELGKGQDSRRGSHGTLCSDVQVVHTSHFETPPAFSPGVLLTTPCHRRGRGAGCRWAGSLDIDLRFRWALQNRIPPCCFQTQEKRNPNSQCLDCSADTSATTMYFHVCLPLGHAIAICCSRRRPGIAQAVFQGPLG